MPDSAQICNTSNATYELAKSIRKYCKHLQTRAYGIRRIAFWDMKLKNCQNYPGWLLGRSWARSWDALGVFLGVLGRSWGAPGDPPGLRYSLKRLQASPWTLFSYLFFQAGLLHAALGSLLRLSCSLSNWSCLPDSPSGRFFFDFA